MQLHQAGEFTEETVSKIEERSDGQYFVVLKKVKIRESDDLF